MADFKELKSIIAFCHKHGVTRFKNGDIEVDLTALPPKKKKAIPVTDSENLPGFPDWNSLSKEQQLLYSSVVPGSERQD